MVEQKIVEERIQAGVADVQHLHLEDLTGGQDHYRAIVVSPAFEGMSRVQQHQSVYAALGELMSGPVHALALQTYTPEAWAAQAEK